MIECIADRAVKIERLRTSDEMHDDFSVAVGLKDGTTMLEPAAPLGGVGEVAIVAKRHFTLVAVDHDGLGVEQGFVARR